MGGKKKYIEVFGSFTEPFNCRTDWMLCFTKIFEDSLNVSLNLKVFTAALVINLMIICYIQLLI